MITNEREYEIAKAQLRRFESAAAPSAPDVDPRILEAMRAAARSQADDLRRQVDDYERGRHLPVPELAVLPAARKAGVPDDLAARLAEYLDPADVAPVVARGFGWDIDGLLAGMPQQPALAESAQFKAPRVKDPEASPMVHLALAVAEITVATASRPVRALPPADPGQLGLGKRPTLATLVRWAWNAGIPVIPLTGSKGFTAAVWRIGERPAIVLKRPTDLHAYWLFDLAHELGHVARGHVQQAGVVDVAAPLSASRDEQEREANEWALSLLLPEYAGLVEDVSHISGGNRLKFKGAVERVARENDLIAGLLGFVAAYALPDLGRPQDRWGSATNLAKREGAARPTVEAAFTERINLSALPRIDELLMRAAVLTSEA